MDIAGNSLKLTDSKECAETILNRLICATVSKPFMIFLEKVITSGLLGDIEGNVLYNA